MIDQNPQITRHLKNLFPETLAKGAKQVFGKRQIFPVLLELLVPDSEQRQAAPAASDILHPNEDAMFSKYAFPKRRSEYLTGRACAKMAVQGLLTLKNSGPAVVLMVEIEIANEAGGRPVVRLHADGDGPGKLDISISHSGAYGAALAAESQCGIDLQEKKAALLKVQEKYCSENEYILLEKTMPDHETLSRLALLWAAKEAAKKALSGSQLPGFLDLELRELENYPTWSALHLHISQEKNQQLPEKVSVVTAMFNDYALAICLVREESHAGTA